MNLPRIETIQRGEIKTGLARKKEDNAIETKQGWPQK